MLSDGVLKGKVILGLLLLEVKVLEFLLPPYAF